MKKVLSFLLLLLCLSSSFLFAVDITATGTGATEEEAKQDARVQLSEMIFGTSVFSLTTTKTFATSSSFSQDASSSSSSFQSTNNFITSGKLIGVEYKIQNSSSKKVTVTATIPDTAYTIYEENIKNAATTVKNLYNRNNQLTNKNDTNYFTLKKSLLLNLYNALIEYQSYRQILIYMQHSSSVVDLNLDISVQSISFDYESLLIEEENAIRAKIGVTGAASSVDYINLQYELNQNIKAQSELKRQQEEILRQVEEQRIAEINSQMKNVLESTAQVTITNLSDSFWETYQELKNAINTYNSLVKQYNDFLRNELSKIEQTYSTNRKAVERKAYPSAQLQDGAPTAIALEFRRQELNELSQARDKDRQSVTKLVSDNFATPLQNSYDTVAKLLISLQESTYIASVSAGDYTMIRSKYEGNYYRWPFSLIYRDGFSALNLSNLFINYKDLSGKDPYTGKDRLQYEAYSALVTAIESRELANFTDYYDIKVTFKIVINTSKDQILIDFQKVQLTTKDGKLIRELTGYKQQVEGWTTFRGVTIPKSTQSFIKPNSHINDAYNAYQKAIADAEEAKKREQEALTLAEEMRRKAEEQARKMEEEKEKERIRLENLAIEQARQAKLEKLKKKRIIMRNESFVGVSAYASYGLGYAKNLGEYTISAGVDLDIPILGFMYLGVSPSFMYSEMRFNGIEGTETGKFYRFAVLADGGIMTKYVAIGGKYGLSLEKTHYWEVYGRIYLGGLFEPLNLLFGVANDTGLKSIRAYIGGQYVF